VHNGAVDLGRAPAKRPPGWWRWAAFGCGVVVVALVLALAWGAFSTRRMLVWGVSRLSDRVAASLPDGTPAVVREALRRQLDCVIRAAREGRVSEGRLGEFARACTEALADRAVVPDEERRIAGIADDICHEAGAEAP